VIVGSTPWVVRYKRSFLLKYRLRLHSWRVERSTLYLRRMGVFFLFSFFFVFFFVFPRWCLVRVRVKDGRGERCRRALRDKGAGGVHKGHFYIPGGMVVLFRFLGLGLFWSKAIIFVFTVLIQVCIRFRTLQC